MNKKYKDLTAGDVIETCCGPFMVASNELEMSEKSFPGFYVMESRIISGFYHESPETLPIPHIITCPADWEVPLFSKP